MPDTSKIQSGFDAELQLGRLWFLTAIQALIHNGVIDLPNGISVTDAHVIDDPDWDLEMRTNVGLSVRASIVINGNQFVFATDLDNEQFEIDLPNFGQLAGPPILQKVIGSNGFENAMCLLLNLDIRASDQNLDPLSTGDHLDRGDPANAVSFLPDGQHISLGLARESFKRFANNIWHTELRDTDGSHPLPKPGEEKKGDWKRVKVSVNQQRIKFTLEGEVPIDLWPDADVRLDLELKPKLVNGKLTFEIDTDLDVDTGFWGDVLAFTVGALAGFLIGLFTGGLLLIPAIGLGSVIVLEVAEHIVGEVLERRIIAKDSSGNQLTHQNCSQEIIKFASPKPSEDGLSIGALDSIPTSVPIFSDTDDALFTRTVLVAANYDEITLNGKGLAIAGKSELAESFVPQVARLVESTYEQNELKQLKYTVPSSGNELTLNLDEVIDRLAINELRPPVNAESELDDPVFVIPSGRLCCPCLIPTHIRRKDTVITRIRFDTGLELNTPDAVLLQDNAGVYLEGLQLLHPSNANPYFRAPANQTKSDNFEELPEF